MFKPLIAAYAQSDGFGKFIFLMLTLLSIINFIVIAYKCYLTFKLKQSQEDASLQFQKNKNALFVSPFDFLTHQAGFINPFATLYELLKTNALMLLQKNKDLQKHEGSTFLSSTDVEQLGAGIEMKIYAEKKAYEKYLFLLPMAASLGPLFGLLGTVWGISVTFNQLPHSANALSSDAVLSGLSMALGTTVYGILVAIPALIMQYFFRGCSENYVMHMNQFSSDLLQSVETQYRAVDV